MLDRRNVIARFQQRRGCSGIQPRHPAAKQFYVQFAVFEVKQIQIGDLQFAACRWTQGAAKIHDFMVVNIKTRHSKSALWLLWFFLEANRFPFGIELDYAVSLRVANWVAENARATLDCQRLAVKIEFAVENIVSEDQRRPRIADKFCTN